jgi:hypothetical protein
MRAPSPPITGHIGVPSICLSSQLHRESTNRIILQAGGTGEPISKMTKAKRVGGTAHAVEYLPNECKALSLTPSTLKNKNK